MKTENENKRTKRKEIQFNETEYAIVEQKANAARLSVAAFIREAALGKELSAALTIEESERIKRTRANKAHGQHQLQDASQPQSDCTAGQHPRLTFCNGCHPRIHLPNQRIFQDWHMA